ncbi:MAG: hypothetical protein J0L92_25510, partial [Deltaproteobacteria bacterium]|nr:hypothetical protein [Deltaproteobacteria bacterium]
MDAFLVRYGELVGVCVALLLTLAVLGVWIATRARARSAHVARTLGPRDGLQADAIGKVVVIEGVLREGPRVERFARPGDDDVLATTVRVATSDDDAAIVAKRGRDLALVVDGQHVRVAGEVVELERRPVQELRDRPPAIDRPAEALHADPGRRL